MAVPSDSPSCLNSLPAHIPNVEELVVSPLPQRLATRAYSLAVEIMNWNLVLLGLSPEAFAMWKRGGEKAEVVG